MPRAVMSHAEHVRCGCQACHESGRALHLGEVLTDNQRPCPTTSTCSTCVSRRTGCRSARGLPDRAPLRPRHVEERALRPCDSVTLRSRPLPSVAEHVSQSHLPQGTSVRRRPDSPEGRSFAAPRGRPARSASARPSRAEGWSLVSKHGTTTRSPSWTRRMPLRQPMTVGLSGRPPRE